MVEQQLAGDEPQGEHRKKQAENGPRKLCGAESAGWLRQDAVYLSRLIGQEEADKAKNGDEERCSYHLQYLTGVANFVQQRAQTIHILAPIN
jgi:hypothetical protein